MLRAFLVLTLLVLPALVFGQEEFVPLTGIPGVQDLSEQGNLAAFLNVLYRLCVGVAAVLAVVQIIRAGFLWMKGDSVTGSKEARGLIQMSIFGLLLVLSPAIVFGIIDPRILNLSLDTSDLRLGDPSFVSDRERSLQAAQRASTACGVPLRGNEETCLTSGNEDVFSCFPAGLSEEQQQCILDVFNVSGATNWAFQCEGLGTQVGAVVQPDRRHCCAVHGLHPHPDERSSSFVCMAEPYTPPEAGTGQDSYGTPYLNVATQEGTYGTLRVNSDSTQTCIATAYGSFEDEASCLSASTQHEQTHGDTWFTIPPKCKREDGTVRQVNIINEGVPFCPNIEPL